MDRDELFEYRSAAKACAIVARARDSMQAHEIAAELGVSESTIRMWRANPDSAISMKTARAVRRLDRRMK